MAITDLRQTNIQILNEVQRKLGVNATSTITETKHATLLLRFLNETIDECADNGDWLELFETVSVTAVSSTDTYTVAASALVQHIHEIRWHTDPSPLEIRSISDIRRLLAKPSYGTPRQFALTDVDETTGQPRVRVYPVPTTARVFDVSFYEKPRLYTTADVSATAKFPANVLIQGTYEKALLDEYAGEMRNEWVAERKRFEKMMTEARNRFTTDTGTEVRFVPFGGYG